MDRIFVLAGNYGEFSYWQREDYEKRGHATFISSPEQLRGIRGHLVKTGRWWTVDERLQEMANFLVSTGDLTWDASET